MRRERKQKNIYKSKASKTRSVKELPGKQHWNYDDEDKPEE